MTDVDGSTDRPGLGVVLPPGEGHVIPLGEAGTATLKAVGDQTGGRLSAYQFAMPPATAAPPLHLHRNWDEAFYVLEGAVTVLIDGQMHTARAGAVRLRPARRAAHLLEPGAGPCHATDGLHPVRHRRYFKEATTALAAGGDDSRATAITLMEKHLMVVPPGSRPAYGALRPPDAPTTPTRLPTGAVRST